MLSTHCEIKKETIITHMKTKADHIFSELCTATKQLSFSALSLSLSLSLSHTHTHTHTHTHNGR